MTQVVITAPGRIKLFHKKQLENTHEDSVYTVEISIMCTDSNDEEWF